MVGERFSLAQRLVGKTYSVDEDFDKTEGPDGLHIVGGGVHLRHEAELAHGERVGEDDVGGRQESRLESHVRRRPGGPGDSGHATSGVGGDNSSRDNGDSNGDNNGDEIDVSKNGKLGEAGRHGEREEDDGGDGSPDQCADRRIVHNTDKCDGACQGVRTDKEDEEQCEHDTSQLVSEASPDELDGIGVVLNVRVLQLDLANNVGRVDGDETDANTEDNTGDHSDGSESAGHTEGAERDGLDDQEGGELHPSQAVVLLLALVDGGGALEVAIIFLLGGEAGAGLAAFLGQGGRVVVGIVVVDGFGQGTGRLDDAIGVGGHVVWVGVARMGVDVDVLATEA